MDTRNKPEKGQRYRHYKGGTYEILCLAMCTETKLEGVVYRSEQYGTVYFRYLTVFMSSVSDTNQHRFEQICTSPTTSQ